MDAALALVGLSKSFGAKRAVDGLDLQVRPGCMFGLVGPNGAGKTTTLSMATGLLRPDAGTAYVLGHDVWTDPAAAKARMVCAARRAAAVRPAERFGAAALRGLASRRVPPADIATRSTELLEALSLAEDRNTLVVEYSAGMTKKIGLACALISAPRLLILDEPFEEKGRYGWLARRTYCCQLHTALLARVQLMVSPNCRLSRNLSSCCYRIARIN